MSNERDIDAVHRPVCSAAALFGGALLWRSPRLDAGEGEHEQAS